METDEFDSAEGVTLTFKNISYKATLDLAKYPWQRKTMEKQILHNISGSVSPGRVLAIMGPTGSGKTSLLNVLSGRVGKGVSGEILVNGKRYSRSIRRRTAFVMQKDIFFSDLTVKETLTLTARLRLPYNLSKEEKLGKVDSLIEELMLEKAANTIVGATFPFKRGISGGEQKRLNIGNELLTDPLLFMVDEPTAGLDSSTAWAILNILKRLAMRGKAVIMTIHQPSSLMYTLFDDLMLLSDGHVVYYGPAEDATSYFSTITKPCPNYYNPADYLLQLIVMDKDDEGQPLKNKLISYYEDKGINEIDLHKDDSLEEPQEIQITKWPCPYFEQFRLLGWRSFRQKKGTVFQQLYVSQVLIAIAVISLIWFQLGDDEEDIDSKFGLLFFSTVYWMLIIMLRVIASFPAERGVLTRERATGTYQISAFYFSKQLSETSLELILPIIFCTIIYWATGLNPRVDKFFIYMAAILLDVAISYSVGLWIAAAILQIPKAAVMATTYFMTTMLLGGFYIDKDELPNWLSWAQYLSPVRYIFEILIINEFKGETYGSGIDGDDILDEFDMDEDFFIYDFILLIVILFGTSILGYLSLRFLNR